MGEGQVIERTKILNTRESLVRDFRRIGIKKGMIVIVHSSLSSIGWVCGGAVTVIQALMDIVTRDGTIIMPAHSGDYSDPTNWGNPPVPKEWIEVIKDTMPAFHEEITPTRGMGMIAETFRKFPNVLRSSHPALSFCAWGNNAEEIIENHSLDYSLGEESPLARIYDLNGDVLLLGVGHNNNTSFHLSENRMINKKYVKAGGPIIKDGIRVWKEYDDIEVNSDVFDELGKDFEKNNNVSINNIGLAESRLFSQKVAVDFGHSWLDKR